MLFTACDVLTAFSHHHQDAGENPPRPRAQPRSPRNPPKDCAPRTSPESTSRAVTQDAPSRSSGAHVTVLALTSIRLSTGSAGMS